MSEISLSLAGHWIPDNQLTFQNIINKLANDVSFSLEIDFIDWSDMWTRLSDIATHKQGPMISEVGSTWIASFHAKDALHHFTESDIDAIGGEHAFLAWEVGSPAHQINPVAIPWMADSQVVYYWKDMLSDAEVNIEDAFLTMSNFEHMLDLVASRVVKYPWAISTTRFPANLHQMACWVWGMGGDFLDDRGRSIRFLEDETIQAMVNFFSLHRYIPEYRTTSPIEMADYFARRETAVVMGGIKIYQQIKHHLSDEQMQRVGVSLPPGIPFVGCESLVLWSHTPDDCLEESIEVIRRLMSSSMQTQLASVLDLLPTRIEMLHQSPYNVDPFLRTLGRAITIGRSYPAVPVWGEIEEHLLNTLVAIWEDIFRDHNPDIDNIVRKHLIRLGQAVRSLV